MHQIEQEKIGKIIIEVFNHGNDKAFFRTLACIILLTNHPARMHP